MTHAWLKYSSLLQCNNILMHMFVPTSHLHGKKDISLGPTVFRGPRNFKPNHEICPFPWNFDIAVKFRGILQKLRNDR